MYDVIVLGCGVSGMTIARLLAGQGCSVIVIDEYSAPGGNHISRDFGPYTVDIGSILFWAGSEFAKALPEVAAAWHPARTGIDRIAPDGTVRRYPIDVGGEVLGRSPVYAARVAAEILWQRIAGSPSESVPAFVRYYLGATLLADSGLSNYLHRFYGLPIEQVAFELAGKRMNWIVENGSIRKRLVKSFRHLRTRIGLTESGELLPTYVRPRSGFGAMYRPVVAALEGAGVRFSLGSPLETIEKKAGDFEVCAGGQVIRSQRLVSTIPLGRMAALVGLDERMLPMSLPLATLCVRFRGSRASAAPILYNFHKCGAWKRLTMHSDWYGEADGYQYLGVEIPLTNPAWTLEGCFEDFRAMTATLGIFSGELDYVGGFTTDYAYPRYDRGAAAKARATLYRIGAMGIETAGRQGNFDYIPAASQAALKVRRQFGAETAQRRP